MYQPISSWVFNVKYFNRGEKSDEENQILSNVPVPVIKIVFHKPGSVSMPLTRPTARQSSAVSHELWQHHFKFPLKTRHIRATSECLIKSTYIHPWDSNLTWASRGVRTNIGKDIDNICPADIIMHYNFSQSLIFIWVLRCASADTSPLSSLLISISVPRILCSCTNTRDIGHGVRGTIFGKWLIL